MFVCVPCPDAAAEGGGKRNPKIKGGVIGGRRADLSWTCYPRLFQSWDVSADLIAKIKVGRYLNFPTFMWKVSAEEPVPVSYF